MKRREPSLDFQSAMDAGIHGKPDLEVLARAAGEGRILVSHDRKTMPRHFATFVAMRSSPGLILVSQDLDIGMAIEELLLIWSASDASEWVDSSVAIPL